MSERARAVHHTNDETWRARVHLAAANRLAQGKGSLELSALSIHAPLHRITGANVILRDTQTES